MKRSPGDKRRVAFLTMEDTAGWSIDADLAFDPLADLGWQAEWLPWRTPNTDWHAWDAVYLAATWDYPDDPGAFLRVLESIAASRAILVNDLEIVRWNIPKTYLRDLERGGARIVPSLWFERFADADLEQAFERFDTGRLIVKPVVSTNAHNTFLIDRNTLRLEKARLEMVFRCRAFVVQPFLSAVTSEGEYSLFHIGEGISHGIRKVPKSGDFRVQEEHGASITDAAPTPEMRAAAENAIGLVPAPALYGRCDFVRDSAGELCIMELELIEPSLYLRMHEAAPRRFAEAFDRHIRQRGSGKR